MGRNKDKQRARFDFMLDNLHKKYILKLVERGDYDDQASFIREAIREKLKYIQDKGKGLPT
jgi:Arc/MetJ-type ribon-helix-helix transcriptional regulator